MCNWKFSVVSVLFSASQDCVVGSIKANESVPLQKNFLVHWWHQRISVGHNSAYTQPTCFEGILHFPNWYIRHWTLPSLTPPSSHLCRSLCADHTSTAEMTNCLASLMCFSGKTKRRCAPPAKLCIMTTKQTPGISFWLHKASPNSNQKVLRKVKRCKNATMEEVSFL